MGVYAHLVRVQLVLLRRGRARTAMAEERGSASGGRTQSRKGEKAYSVHLTQFTVVLRLRDRTRRSDVSSRQQESVCHTISSYN